MLLGSAGVGKTSLKRSLMKLLWEPHTTSTVISDISCVRPFGHQWYNMNQEDDDKLVEVTIDDEIVELAKLLSLVYHDPSNTMSAHGKITASALYSIASMINASSLSSKQIEDIEGTDVDSILSMAIDYSESMFPDDLKNVKPQPFLHIWDCGGQPVFLEILPAFLTPRTMFLLMFDASKDFNERWQSVQHRAGDKIFDEVVNVTTLGLMLNWMASIYGNLIRQEHDGSLCEYPRMYCIGTHGDILKTNEKKKAVVEQIESHYKDMAYFELIKDTLIIDNTISGKGIDEDPNITILRRAICQFIHDKLIVKTPISWVLFRKVIQLYQKNVINLEEAHAIGAACKIPHDDVPKALLFNHDLGVVLFYPHIEGLKDKVIIKPKWFVDTLGKLFTLDGRDGRIRTMLTLLQEKGILVQTLYVSIWRECTTELNPEAIIELLVNFRLAAPVTTKEYHDPTVKQYFLPAMLKSFDGDPSEAPHGHYLRATPLHIIFSTKFVPPGFFTRFVTTFASNPLCKCTLVFKDGVYRNRVSFTYGQPPIDHIILTDLHFAIQVDVLRYAPENPAFKSINTVCQELLTVLQYCGQQVEQVLASHLDFLSERQCIHITKEFQYVCNQCLNSSNLHYLMIGEEQSVDMPICCGNNRSYRKLNADEAVWFKEVILPKQVCTHISRYHKYYTFGYRLMCLLLVDMLLSNL